jgi:hypothetical protein
MFVPIDSVAGFYPHWNLKSSRTIIHLQTRPSDLDTAAPRPERTSSGYMLPFSQSFLDFPQHSHDRQAFALETAKLVPQPYDLAVLIGVHDTRPSDHVIMNETRTKFKPLKISPGPPRPILEAGDRRSTPTCRRFRGPRLGWV